MIAFYPETKGKTLEEMDGLFGKLLTDTERDAHSTKSPEEEADGGIEQQAIVESGKL